MKPPKPKKTRRRCLKCNRSFWSEGRWNRVCSKCNRKNRQIRECRSSPPRWNGEPMYEQGQPL